MSLNNQTKKAVVVPSAGVNPHVQVESLALVNAAGADLALVTTQAAQADSVAATVGALVTDFNALLAKLRLAKVIS